MAFPFTAVYQGEASSKNVDGSLRGPLRALQDRSEQYKRRSAAEVAKLVRRNEALLQQLQCYQETPNTHTRDVLPRLNRSEDPPHISALEARIERLEKLQPATGVDIRLAALEERIDEVSAEVQKTIDKVDGGCFDERLGSLETQLEEHVANAAVWTLPVPIDDLEHRKPDTLGERPEDCDAVAFRLLARLMQFDEAKADSLDGSTLDHLVEVLTNVQQMRRDRRPAKAVAAQVLVTNSVGSSQTGALYAIVDSDTRLCAQGRRRS